MRIIDLNGNGAERFDNSDKVLQVEAFEKLDKLIREQVAKLDSPIYVPPNDKQISYARPHNGILIEGGRGSGKTTFLINALQYLQNEKNDIPKKLFRELSSTLQVLPPIDPTLIETKENIVVVIISLIDSALNDISINPNADRTRINEARREMAEGLGLLDGIGKSKQYGDEWEDPEWIMSRGLRKSRGGRTFERKFQTYIYECLKVLNKKAFVLAFDDVDTNFQHGGTILETIRKYLTSPQLILLVSGDLELYGRLVRRNIYETFGNIMENDPKVIGEGRTGIAATVQELEEQYLLKIVPPQNRISMMPLGGILQAQPSTEVMVVPFDETEKYPLREWASRNIRRHLLESASAHREQHLDHPFLELISREHLRLVIGYLRAVGEHDSALGSRGVFAVFGTRLRLSGLDSLQLSHATHNDALLLAFRWLVAQDKPASLARFGVPSNADKAIILHCLALAISKGLAGAPANCLSTLLTLNIPIALMQRTGLSSDVKRKAILEFIWEDASPDLLHVAGAIGSIARYDTNEENSGSIGNLRASCFGSVGTKKSDDRADLMLRMFALPLGKSSASPADSPKTVDELNKASEKGNSPFSAKNWLATLTRDQEIAALKPQKGIVWFPLEDLAMRCGEFGALLQLVTYDRYSGRGERFKSVSALSLLAAVSKILSDEGNCDLNKLMRNSIIPAFLPDADISRAGLGDMDDESRSDDGDELHPTEPPEQEGFTKFIESINCWKRFARNYSGAVMEGGGRAEVSPSDLARIAERIHDQLLSLDEAVTLEWNTGHILHRQITNVLHALLVTTSGSSGRLASPKSSDRTLGEALRRISDKKDALHPLAAIVLACPLVWAFLNPEEVYSVSATSTSALADEVATALNTFQEGLAKDKPRFESAWIRPPNISIVIGRRNVASPRTVTQKGFFDVLNVVPRYYPKLSVTSVPK